MKLLMNGSRESILDFLFQYPDTRKYIGYLVTPRFSEPIKDMDIGVDNEAFCNFNKFSFMNLIVKMSYYNPIWISVPDVVGDAETTLKRFYEWKPIIIPYKIPLAFVAQDGIEKVKIPWDEFRCLFIGGTTEFKLSIQVDKLIKEAQERSKLVHVGRVNSLRRIRHFHRLKVDTFDGSGISKFIDSKLKKSIDLLIKLG